MIRRIKQLERLETELMRRIQERPEEITLIYEDGHEEETVDDLKGRQKQISGYLAVLSFHDGWSDSIPANTVIAVKHGDGTIEDFKEQAQRPPLTEEEIEALFAEIMENANSR